MSHRRLRLRLRELALGIAWQVQKMKEPSNLS